ncbi:adenylosuccinate lyase family protein [Lutimaribacter sp. EGI FJ00015]|uniref:Adenylosuccinate lyase family protein n=1 Tax=Lutimaribacter degradans TaxID=2945989 RepID=A0ACC5ZX24_9RHOB|nr:adenylosuccinate lyase family protein [Lutimaribacter sp. EGI FJ00013]MCM2562898.1 adenylosuccinate lyase family protein [Lutimaribacter sp. EGI FJ00013]MCO0614065.1 adenylosuccinate lyase family protein [Lutimaribacter sp. EGI FJ00015]MCO0636043.1 adenylosuccinate lyase family protein [Lutimaribacter sp. EGI FJ00014]
MAGSVYDSPLYHLLFPAGDVGKLFTDSAEIRAMLLVEGALAQAQGALGVIPETAAAFIHRAAMEVQIDPAGLAAATGQNGVTVPGLVAAFRRAMEAPDYAQYLHWGATSQDIMDTGLMLRLRQFLSLLERDMRTTLVALARLATPHAETPMAARTYGQHATPTSFGAVAAGWGQPLLTLLDELPALRARLVVSLSGAAGTSAALGPQADATRAAMAKSLGLADSGQGWHADRSSLQAICAWATRVATACGKMGEDLLLLTQSGIAEVTLDGAGGSSTMPQKQNPVGPSAMVALARQIVALNGVMQGAGLHREQRDGAAWFSEWLTLPQLCLGTAATLSHAQRLAETLTPDPAAMRATLDGGQGLIHAEALSFRLSETMPRPEAQARVKALCKEALAEKRDLAGLARAAFPDLPLDDVFDPSFQMGQAPDTARRFAQQVANLPDPG